MEAHEMKMTEEVTALVSAMLTQRNAMQNLNASYGGKNGGIDYWRLSKALDGLAENLEILAFYENLLNEAKAATADLQAAMVALPELIEYETAMYSQT